MHECQWWSWLVFVPDIRSIHHKFCINCLAENFRNFSGLIDCRTHLIQYTWYWSERSSMLFIQNRISIHMTSKSSAFWYHWHTESSYYELMPRCVGVVATPIYEAGNSLLWNTIFAVDFIQFQFEGSGQPLPQIYTHNTRNSSFMALHIINMNENLNEF